MKESIDHPPNKLPNLNSHSWLQMILKVRHLALGKLLYLQALLLEMVFGKQLLTDLRLNTQDLCLFSHALLPNENVTYLKIISCLWTGVLQPHGLCHVRYL